MKSIVYHSVKINRKHLQYVDRYGTFAVRRLRRHQRFQERFPRLVLSARRFAEG